MTTAISLVDTRVTIDLADLFPELCRLANAEDRTVDGQLKHMLKEVMSRLADKPKTCVSKHFDGEYMYPNTLYISRGGYCG